MDSRDMGFSKNNKKFSLPKHKEKTTAPEKQSVV